MQTHLNMAILYRGHENFWIRRESETLHFTVLKAFMSCTVSNNLSHEACQSKLQSTFPVQIFPKPLPGTAPRPSMIVIS
jgi:hypothetical protein